MVRKFLLSMALCAAAFGAGGFVPSGSAAQTQPLSVKEALKLRDDSFVVIDGGIKHRAVEHAIDAERAACFVDLVFDIRAVRDLDHCIDFIGV